jgi:hypothetical protein
MDGILKKCPNIDVVQLRVNHEAGVSKKGNGPTNTHELFWNTMIDTIAGIGRTIKLDLRAKGVTDGMIAHALAKGLDIAIPTKYWCEHAALPYHISKLRSEEISSRQDMNYSRRYSYGNLLKKPRWYDVIYRLWNYGSTNLFLWADPDYCARFSKSIRMGGGIGFEINSPLALKGGMEDHADKPWSVFRDPELAAAQWEDERYWAYYLVFGRYGYSSRAKYETILREFTLRFGAEGASILDLYESAGKILPLITTVHFPVHPSLQYWPELYPGAALFAKNNYDRSFGEVTYASALPSDEELFYGIAEYVEDQAAGRVKAKYSPLLMRNKLHTLAHKVRSLLAACGCSENSRGEKRAIWVDFTMTALLADFHAWKSAAAYHLYRYQKKSALDALKAAYGEAVNARGIWAELSGLGSRYYHHDLQFNAGWGEGRHKNWQERLEKEVDVDVKDLEALLVEAGESPAEFKQGLSSAYYSLESPAAITLCGQVPAEWHTGEDLKLAVHAAGDGTIREIFLNYRHMDHTEGEYLHVPMKKEGAEYTGVIPADYFSGLYDVIVYFSALDTEDRVVIYPGIDNQNFAAPYFVIDTINAGETRKQP